MSSRLHAQLVLRGPSGALPTPSVRFATSFPIHGVSAHAAACPFSALLLGKGSEWRLWLEKDAFIWTRFGAQSGHPTALNSVAGQSRLAFGAGRACTKAFLMENYPFRPGQNKTYPTPK
ncbi:MAG: hypothetical protein ACK5XI_15850 [Hyphomonadaceae bacterium]